MVHHLNCPHVPIVRLEDAKASIFIVGKKVDLIETHLEITNFDYLFPGSFEETKGYKEKVKAIKQRFSTSVKKDDFKEYEKIMHDAIDLKKELDRSQLSYNYSIHRTNLELEGSLVNFRTLAYHEERFIVEKTKDFQESLKQKTIENINAEKKKLQQEKEIELKEIMYNFETRKTEVEVKYQ
jgi:hypothetical protein